LIRSKLIVHFNAGHLSWYETHLDAIRSHAHASKVALTVHITRETSDTPEKGKGLEHQTSFTHVEKSIATVTQEPVLMPTATKFGRPGIKEVIQAAVARAQPGHRVLVVACGPSGLMKDVRRSVAATIHPSGPGVQLHCEQFGW
jgi:ferredoxin-NADP reductase